MSGSDAHRTIETVWRIEAPRLIAGLTRLTRDVGRAEELAQEALVAALAQWPDDGVPRNPGAWLMQVGKRRGLDALRHERIIAGKRDEIDHSVLTDRLDEPDLDEALDDAIGDDRLTLIFTACHPVLPREAKLALTLKLLCGLTTGEIARAFLVPEATMAQRIVRAKKTLSAAAPPYEVPQGEELGRRLASVLEVVYLIFNEGYAATAGENWVRPSLCEEAMRLGRILAGLAPREPEVHGLVALMELQASRLRARVGRDGLPILLLDQDRARWDHLLIGRGLAGLARGERLAGGIPGPFLLQAALAACHARARTPNETDWQRIAALYGVLARIAPSPIVELNRAVAVGMAEGPAAGLALVDRLLGEPALARYHLLPSVRGDLLDKLGRYAEAADAFEQAVGLTGNASEKRVMQARAEAARLRSVSA